MSSRASKICVSTPSTLRQAAWPTSLRFRRQRLTLLTRLLTTNKLPVGPMEDYQVRDTMRRATTPELYVRLSLPRGKTAGIEFAYQSEMSKPIILNALVGNRSAQPAFRSCRIKPTNSSLARGMDDQGGGKRPTPQD